MLHRALAFAVFSVAALQTAPASAPLLSLLDERDGACEFPQLFDLRPREPIWSSQTARAATFFPLPTAKGRR